MFLGIASRVTDNPSFEQLVVKSTCLEHERLNLALVVDDAEPPFPHRRCIEMREQSQLEPYTRPRLPSLELRVPEVGNDVGRRRHLGQLVIERHLQ